MSKVFRQLGADPEQGVEVLHPTPHVRIDPAVRSGAPVIEGTRIPTRSLAESLRQRGFDAVALNELRESIYERSGREGGSIGDDEVCDEVARVPSVLITLADIVHRHAHRIVRLYGEVSKVASVSRTGARVRSVDEIPTLQGGDEQGGDQ